ncbi:MAG: hypothetical protein ABFS17_05300 [Chloroflexota bacterium]
MNFGNWIKAGSFSAQFEETAEFSYNQRMERKREKQRVWIELLLVILLLAAFIAPRAVDLDRFITIDEGLWMYHSSQFYYALGQRDFEHTFQRFHPGVTMMWAGTLGFLDEFPEFRSLGQGYFGDGLQLGEFLEAQGVSPLALVTAGRVWMIAQNAVLFLLAYWALRQFIPTATALLVFTLIALEPFYLSLSYILQMDGLMASYMLVSMLALLVYLYAWEGDEHAGKKRVFLLLSAVTAGGAILTKAPAVFLVLFTGLMLLIRQVEEKGFSLQALTQRMVLPMMIWLAAAGVVIVALWPAMWVDPLGMLGDILANSANRLTAGIPFRLFFNGETLNARDFGWSFYPRAFIWRSSPAVLVGLVVTAAAWVKRWGLFAQEKVRRMAVGLLLAALFFMVEMSLGEMKMDRYLIPVGLTLTCVSGLGWAALAQRVSEPGKRLPKFNGVRSRALILMAVLLAGWQLTQLASTFPYYYAYYNPLLGGTKGAEEMFWLGWGEGLEQVGAYLNEQPNAEQLSVMSMHAYGPLSYYFDGESVGKPWPEDLTFDLIENLDYMVVYVSDRQTGHHPLMLEVLEPLAPEFVVEINGVEYARLYKLAEVPAEGWEMLRAGLAGE